MASLLAVEKLTVRFGRVPVLSDLSFHVERGDALAVIGPNGSGKTVLFRALLGRLPSEGRIAWAPGVRFGYVPQKLDIERDLPLTGRDLLLAKARFTGSQADIPAVVSQVDLGADMKKPIGQLSGGQFQRLLVALALLGRTNVLLLDEPTAGIDEPSHVKLNGLLRRLQKEQDITVLFISHELNVVSELATRVLCLSRQRAWFGTPRAILTPEKLSEAYGMPVQFHVHDD